jgi:hypothetical protein
MGLLSTSDEALVQNIHDAFYNVDATTRFGEITLRFQVSAKRIIAGEVSCVRRSRAELFLRKIVSCGSCTAEF